MSKRDMRARRLLAAVLLTMSVQVWYAQPLWAAQPAATTTATETTAAGNSADTTAKTANTETDKTDNTEATTKPVADATPIGYSSRSASPMAASDGDISTFGSESSNMTSYGLDARATGNGASAFGNNAQATGNYASVFGAGAAVAIASNSSAFGFNARAEKEFASAFGTGSRALGINSSAFGGQANASGQDNTAIGWKAYASSTSSVALGVNARAGNESSVAIGANSYTNASNQVAFGNMSNKTTYRNLAGINNIAMTGALTADRGTIRGDLSVGSISTGGSSHISGVDLSGGALTGVVSIDGVTVAGSSAATGLTISSAGDKVTIGGSTNALSSTGFSVNNAGALTAASGTIGGVGLSSGVLTGVTKINGADLKVGIDATSGAGAKSMAFGIGATYTSTSGSTSVDAKQATAFGYGAQATKTSSTAFGADAHATGGVSTAFGSGAEASGDYGVAVGGMSQASGIYSAAMGSSSRAVNEFSVAIGSKSVTTETYQVSFGHKIGDLRTDTATYNDNLFRSLVNVKDIELNDTGAIIGLKSINGVTVAGSSAATGLTIGSTDSKVTIGSSTNALSSIGFSVNNAGALTAASGTVGNISLSSGAITGVNSINGADLIVGDGNIIDNSDGSMAFGKGAVFIDPSVSRPAYAGASAFGYMVQAFGDDASAFGYLAKATGQGGSVFGSEAQATSNGASAFGGWAKATAEGTSAFGSEAQAAGVNSLAVGAQAVVGASHTGSMAIGNMSSTTAANQVSFGHKVGDQGTYTNIYTDNLFRSLVNVKDIELNDTGAITGLKNLNGVTVDGSSAATGLTIGSNAASKVTIGSSTNALSSTGFSVNNAGALTAASVSASDGLTIDANNAFTTNSLKVGGQTVSGDNLEAVAKLSYNTTDGVKINGNVTTAGTINGVGIGTKGGTATDKDNVVLNTIDITKMNSDVGDVNVKTTNISYAPATGTTVDGVVIKSGVVSGVSTINGIGIDASRNLTNVGTINGIDLASLGGSVDFGNITTTIATKASAAVGAATTFSVDNATGNITTVGTINGVDIGTKGGAAADKDNVVLTQGVNTIDITKMNSDVNGLNTATTNISYDTGTGTTVDGVVIKSGALSGVSSIAMNGKITGVTAGTADTDAVNVGQMNTALTGKADASTLASYATTAVMDTKLAAKADANATGLSTENKTAWKGALGVDTLASDVAGKASQTDFTALNNIVTATDTGLVAKTAALETATTGMTYVGTVGSEMTTFAGGVTANSFTVKVGATNYGMAADGTLTAKSIMEGGTALSDTYAAKSALDAKADVSVLANYATTTAMNTALGDYAKTDAMTSAIGTAKTELTKAFGDADTKIRTDFTAADTSLKNELNIEIGKNTTAVGKLETATTGMTYVGTVGSEMTTFAGGVTAGSFTVGATGFGFSATGDMTAKTVNGISISGSDTAAVVGTVNINELKAAVETIKHDGVGTTDTAGIKRTGDGSANLYTTIIEGTLKVGTDGTIANKDGSFAVNSAGDVTAAKINGVTVADSGISGTDTFNGITVKKVGAGSNEIEVGGVNVSALKTTVGDADNGLVKDTADLKSAVNDTTNGLAATYAKAGENATAIGTLQSTVGNESSGLVKTVADMDAAYQTADSALADRATALETATTGMTYVGTTGAEMTTFAGGVTANSFTVNVAGTNYGMAADGTLSAVSISENGKALSATYAAKADTLAGYGIADAYTQSQVDQKISDATDGIASDAKVKEIEETIAGVKRTGDGSGADPYTTTIEESTAITTAGVTVTGTVTATTFTDGTATLTGGKLTGLDSGDIAKDDTAAVTGGAVHTALEAANAKLAQAYADADAKIEEAYKNADTEISARATALEQATTAMTYDVDKTTTTFTGSIVVGDVGNNTHTQITDNAIIFGEGAEHQVTIDASGIHVGQKTASGAAMFADAANGTHIDNSGIKTSAVEATSFNGLALAKTDGDVTLDGINLTAMQTNLTGISYAGGTTTIGNVTVKADELNGLGKLNGAVIGIDSKNNGITIDGVSLKALQEQVDGIDGTGGGGSEYDDTNVKGIKRTGVDAGGKGTTTIEDATSFDNTGMKTSNLEAATAKIGTVDFGATGAMTNVASINGVSFAGGKVGGVELSGGKVNGVDVGALKNSVDSLGSRVTKIENNGGGSGGDTPGTGGANTDGITRPGGDKTNIEGSTTIDGSGLTTNNINSDSITVAGGTENQTVINKDGIVVAEGETNQVTINKDGIHVGENSSVMNDVDGFISDKGLYIGVENSDKPETAKFSIDKSSGAMTSKVGDYSFSNGSGGAKFTDKNSSSYGTNNEYSDTTIKGNSLTTGQIKTDELWVDGNKVTIKGGDVEDGKHINNELKEQDGKYEYNNTFHTSVLDGTTQSSTRNEMDSTDPKLAKPTGNSESASLNTKYDGITQEVNKVTNEGKNTETTNVTTTAGGMNLTHTTTKTDDEGSTTSTIGKTEMTGDSITVGKVTVDADGKETSHGSTTIGSGEVTLNREDGSSIRVGDAIEGLQSDVQEMGSRINEMGTEIKEVGALSAALAGLHPQPQNANTKADFAMAMGSYEGKQALAVGAFYKPDKRTMLSLGASTTSSKHMMNMGISIALDRMPEAERKAQEQAAAAGADNETLNKVLERLASLEQDNQRLAKNYDAIKNDYEDLKAKYDEKDAAEKAVDEAAAKAEAETAE